MKTLSTFAILVIAAFVSSCQKENQTTSPQPAADAQMNSLATTTAVPGTICYNVNLGMIAYYGFHGNANDGSGHGQDGFVYSYDSDGVYPGAVPAVLTTDKYGKAKEAYLFNGTTDEIFAANVFDPNKVVTQFSFYVRYKAKADVTGALISSGDELDGWSFEMGTGGFAWFYTDESWTRQVTEQVDKGTTSIGNNCWVDIAVNFSNKVLTLYINGKLVATKITNMSLPPHFAPGFTIGAADFRYPTDFFNSVIDEVRVYNRPLTTDEISYLYAH